MTQEEKAKAYDEVREKIAIRFGSNVADEIFSQFEMSEDERIRKALIDGFKRYSDGALFNRCLVSDIISWLEKQGDIIENNMLLPFKEYDNLMDSINKKKKEGYEAGYKQGLIDSKNDQHVQPKFKVGDTIRVKNSLAEYVITDIYGGCYHGKGWSLDIISADRSGDYELVEKSTDNDIKEALRTEYEKGRADAIAEVQKSAWSEEDEYMFNSFLCKLEVCGLLSNQEIIWIKNKFKSLRDRVQLQKEWSEEDEEMLEDVKFNFEYNKGEMTDAMIAQYNRFFDKIKSLKPQPKQEWNEYDEEMYKEVLTDIIYAKNNLEVKGCLGLSKIAMKAFNWFSKRYKSITPQTTWKPSDEQMATLWDTIVYVEDCNSNFKGSGSILENLYSDLKKLKE